MYMFFTFLTTLVALAAGALIVMLIVKGINHAQNVRHEMFKETLASGIYDYRLIRKQRRGTAVIGWGIVLCAIGVALLIGFMMLGIMEEAAIGGLVPLFVGLGLILCHLLVGRKTAQEEAMNGEPVKILKDSAPKVIDQAERNE